MARIDDETYERVFKCRALAREIAEARPHVPYAKGNIETVIGRSENRASGPWFGEPFTSRFRPTYTRGEWNRAPFEVGR